MACASGARTTRACERVIAIMAVRWEFLGWYGTCFSSRHNGQRQSAEPNGFGRRRGEATMSLVRWDPFHELEDMSTRLNRLFGRSAALRPVGEAGRDFMTTFDWVPSVDVVETPEEFTIKAELPDVKKDDVHVNVDDRVLRIEGERKQEKEEKGKRFHRVERSYGSFLRTFALPENVDGSKIRAEFKDGILNIRLPKTPTTTTKAQQIKIE